MNEIKQVSLDLIDDPKIAMRTELDDEQLDELITSMKTIGLLEPVVLRPVGGRYEVIAGHRRTRAARLINWPTIESKIIDADDNTAFAMRVAENLTRKDVDPVDEAVFIGEILLKHKLEPDQLAEIIHRRAEWIKERLEIFDMPDYMKEHLRLRKYPLGAALWISRIKNENARITFSNWAAFNGVSVANAKQWYLNEEARNFNFDAQNVEYQAAGSPAPVVRKITTCAKCQKDVFLDEADSVWVHRSC